MERAGINKITQINENNGNCERHSCVLHGAVEVMWGFDLIKGGQESSLYEEVMFELRSESRVDLK